MVLAAFVITLLAGLAVKFGVRRFAAGVLRAVALSISVALAFGLHVQDADWMPIATIVAMKPSLEQSTLIAEQRVAGTIVGAAVAALVLIAADLPHPSNLAAEGRRVLFTFVGVGIAVVIMFLATRLKRPASAAPQSTPPSTA